MIASDGDTLLGLSTRQENVVGFARALLFDPEHRSPDELNDYLRTVIVAPMTTGGRAYP